MVQEVEAEANLAATESGGQLDVRRLREDIDNVAAALRYLARLTGDFAVLGDLDRLLGKLGLEVRS